MRDSAQPALRAPRAAAPVQDLLPLDARAEWEASLEGIRHGIAHTWGFCRAVQRSSGHPTFLYRFAADGVRIVCPLAERAWEGGEGAVDVATPWGFSGFVGTGVHPDFPAAWRAFARERGWVCGYVGLDPLFGGEAHADPAAVRRTHRLYLLDLADGEAALYARLSANRRREIAAFARLGALVEDRERLAAFFLAHHREFFTRRGAAPLYDFSPAALAAFLALDGVLLLGAAPAGALGAASVAAPERIEAVSVFGSTPHAADFLFNVSLPAGRRWSAALIWEAARRLAARGVPLLDLGGGIREGDGVARFKERFGARAVPLASLRQVYDRTAYEALCRRAGADPADPVGPGYFPPYRAPRT